MESKWDAPFGSDLSGTNANQETWSGSLELREAATRQEGVLRGVGRATTLVVASGLFWLSPMLRGLLLVQK